jgi:hypothetical protein
MNVLTLADWLRKAEPIERDMLAGTVGTTVNYLYHLAGGHGMPSIGLASRISYTTYVFAAGDEIGDECYLIGPGHVMVHTFYDE